MKPFKVVSCPDMKVIMRKDFAAIFDQRLKEITRETGATYFGHNLIKNYREKDHTVSTFCNQENWHEFYWNNYRNDDPVEKLCHQAVEKTNFAAMSWEVEANMSLCSRERMKQTGTKDGIFFSFQRKENCKETFSIGWPSLKKTPLDVDYLFHLASLLKPISEHHWAVHDKL